MEMVTTHLCTTCDNYYEAYEMYDIEQHLCKDCAAQKEYEDLQAQVDELRAELAEKQKYILELEAEQGWKPVPQSLEYDLISYAYHHGQMSVKYKVCHKAKGGE